MMTRKHLEFIADSLRQAVEVARGKGTEVEEGVYLAIRILADALDRKGKGKVVTPLFNKTKFLVRAGAEKPFLPF